MDWEGAFAKKSSTDKLIDHNNNVCENHKEAISLLQPKPSDPSIVSQIKKELKESNWDAVNNLYEPKYEEPAYKAILVLHSRAKTEKFTIPTDDNLLRRHYAIILMLVQALSLDLKETFITSVLLMEEYYRGRCEQQPDSPEVTVTNVGKVLTTLLNIEYRLDIERKKECHINVYDHIEFNRDSFTTIYAVYALLFAVGRKRSAYCPRQGLKILNEDTNIKFEFPEKDWKHNFWDNHIMKAMDEELRRGYLRQQGAKIIKLSSSSSLFISFRNRHIYSNIVTTVSNGHIEAKNLFYPSIYSVLAGLSIMVPIIFEYEFTALSTRQIDTFSLVFSLLVISSTIVPILAAYRGDTFTWSRLMVGSICPSKIKIDDLECVVCELTSLTEQYDADKLFGSDHTCAIVQHPQGNTSFNRPLYAYEAELLGVLLLYDGTRKVYCAYDDKRDTIRAVIRTDGPQGCKFDVTASWPGNTSRLITYDATTFSVG
ncbi:hypothetical protein BGW37DRAFT_103176 [Umbelopsis sp. PMI_123]|nr:hypothetical protein BGW37DRAFT_103176 [Umbelopsis sp. PMI_123]